MGYNENGSEFTNELNYNVVYPILYILRLAHFDSNNDFQLFNDTHKSSL